MRNWLTSLVNYLRGSQPKKAGRSRQRLRATYEAASSDPQNEKHWANADSLAADAVNDPATRQLLRDRARYECRNSGYAGGLVESLANDLVGTGPRLQLTIPGQPRDTGRAVENAFANWARAMDLAEDLRVMHETKIRDGECFLLFTDNPALAETGMTPVTLDLAVYEAEQVADPFFVGLDPLYVDGIRRDKAGNPIEYTFLDAHPGGVASWMAFETRKYPASRVLHWFKPQRPGQARGVTTIVAGLPLFAQLRRYTLATLGAAELAAMLAGVMSTDLKPADGSPVKVESMDAIELVRNALLTLPMGWKAEQFEPKQPCAPYPDFKREILGEVGRGIQAPINLVTGDSSRHNFSSAKLDERLYFRTVRVERSRLRNRALDRIFTTWVQEAALANAIPPRLPPVATWAWEWHFDGFESIDPLKDAQTDETELRNNTTTLAEIYARKGLDWEEALRQRAREQGLVRELGITAPAPPIQPAEEVAHVA